jgi:hypothetical protein
MAYASQPADLIYSLTKSMIVNYAAYKDGAPGATGLELSRQNLTWVLPYHEGAVKAFKEAGVWKPEHEAHNQKALSSARTRWAAAWAAFLKTGPPDDKDAFRKAWSRRQGRFTAERPAFDVIFDAAVRLAEFDDPHNAPLGGPADSEITRVRTLKGAWRWLLIGSAALTIFLCVNQQFTLKFFVGFTPLNTEYYYGLLLIMLPLVFLMFPGTPSAPLDRVPWYDQVLFVDRDCGVDLPDVQHPQGGRARLGVRGCSAGR